MSTEGNSEPCGTTSSTEDTKAGNYFVANYPPFHFWDKGTAELVPELIKKTSPEGTPLGVYFHIPFCRKRCHFCYFRVYTDKNASEIQRYLDAGCTGFIPWCPDYPSTETIELFAKHVMPNFR